MNIDELSGSEFWQVLESLGTFIAAVLAFWALWQAKRIFEKQQDLSERLHNQQITLAQRQLFIPLFEQFKEIATIDPQKPVWPDVIKAVNFLDLLGICWEGQLVEESILFRVYREFVIETYDRIKACQNPPSNVEKDGVEMLRDSRAATNLYTHLLTQHINRDRPMPFRKV